MKERNIEYKIITMNTIIKIIILLAILFTVSTFIFAVWCAFNAFNIGDILATVIFITCAVIDLVCSIKLIILLKKQ